MTRLHLRPAARCSLPSCRVIWLGYLPCYLCQTITANHCGADLLLLYAIHTFYANMLSNVNIYVSSMCSFYWETTGPATYWLIWTFCGIIRGQYAVKGLRQPRSRMNGVSCPQLRSQRVAARESVAHPGSRLQAAKQQLSEIIMEPGSGRGDLSRLWSQLEVGIESLTHPWRGPGTGRGDLSQLWSSPRAAAQPLRRLQSQETVQITLSTSLFPAEPRAPWVTICAFDAVRLI